MTIIRNDYENLTSNMRENVLQLRWISAATFLAITTIFVSFTVAYLVNGTFLNSVRMTDLRTYGGTTVEDLRNFEVWRVPLAQMLHAKIPHMLFNAMCLLLLGNLLEKVIGPLKLLLLWLFAGGIATIISPVFVEAPWNVGTGASQAIFAFAGCAAVFAVARILDLRWAIGLIALAVFPGLLLDFIYAGYPKLGHVAGVFFGVVFGLVYLRCSQHTSGVARDRE
jgi:membrane associated rhomboid family serine protease